MTDNKRTKRQKKKGFSVRAKIFTGFFVFVALTLVILALFQVFMLPYLYGAITIRQIKDGSRRLIQTGSVDSMYALGRELAEDSHMEIALLYPLAGSRIRLSPTGYPECVLFDLTYAECQQIGAIAEEKGGSALLSVSNIPLADDPPADPGILPMPGGLQDRGSRYSVSQYSIFSGVSGANVVYAETIEIEGQSYLLLINAYLAPMGATARTLSVILIAVGVLMILLAILLAGYISGRIAGPIVKINARAKVFAAGSYDVRFDEQSGYREASELSATLNQAAAELGKVEKLQRELIANVSHDLRTPLTLISGYSEMMRDIPGQVTPENLTLIIDEVSRLNLLVNDLLETSRIQSGSVSMRPESFCLTDEIGRIIDTYQALTAAKGIRIGFEADGPANVVADRSLIVRAVMNLVNNAMTYTGADRTVLIRQIRKDGFVRIEVSDSGEGIAPDQLELIWDRYYKADAAHKRAVVGTGLGLSIVKSIVTMHGGNYGVRSRVGQGSTFWIEIPEE